MKGRMRKYVLRGLMVPFIYCCTTSYKLLPTPPSRAWYLPGHLRARNGDECAHARVATASTCVEREVRRRHRTNQGGEIRKRKKVSEIH